jgi:hypothetical protein
MACFAGFLCGRARCRRVRRLCQCQAWPAGPGPEHGAGTGPEKYSCRPRGD